MLCRGFCVFKSISHREDFVMKLNIDGPKSDVVRSQGDPYVIKSGDRYYMYATHSDGVQLYVSENRYDWDFRGLCLQVERQRDYWAPAVLEYGGKFYMYYSSTSSLESDERLRVAVSDTPDGDFCYLNDLAAPFSIDPHAVVSGGEIYMFYSTNDYDAERAGTLIVLDKMKTPTELCGEPRVVVRATLDEEKFGGERVNGRDWHTIEGAFYLREGDFHYLMYSGGCYQNDSYFIGYAVARSEGYDLTKLDFKKFPDDNTYLPLVRRSDSEEGTGHNSVLSERGRHYVFYHGRDLDAPGVEPDERTARICELVINDGVLSVKGR